MVPKATLASSQPAKVEPSDRGQGSVAGMIDRLHADNAAGGFGMMARQMRGKFRFCAVRAGDQDRVCPGDSLEKIVVQQGSAASIHVSVVVDVPRRTVGVLDWRATIDGLERSSSLRAMTLSSAYKIRDTTQEPMAPFNPQDCRL